MRLPDVPTISIVIPTIAGREAELERTLRVYRALTLAPVEWLVERGHPTCGAAWNAGAARATGDVLHMAADDLEPESAEWVGAALRVLDAGGVPLGWVREDASSFGRDFCRVPTCRREWWVDVPPDLHYYTDNAFTDAMVAAGHRPVVVGGYDFYHRHSMIGRGAGMPEMERVEHDRRSYLHQRSG